MSFTLEGAQPAASLAAGAARKAVGVEPLGDAGVAHPGRALLDDAADDRCELARRDYCVYDWCRSICSLLQTILQGHLVGLERGDGVLMTTRTASSAPDRFIPTLLTDDIRRRADVRSAI